MSEIKQLFDIDVERNTLKVTLQNKDFCKSIFMFNTIISEHFTDLFHRDVFNASSDYFNKFGIPPSEEKLKNHILKFITYNKAYKTPEYQRKIWVKSVERLFNPISTLELDEKESNVSLLEEFRKARVIQKFMIGAEQSFGTGNYEEIIGLMSETISVTKKVDNVISEGNIIDDFQQHIQVMRQQRLGEIKPISTGIVGVQENMDGSYKLINMDDTLSGGFYPAEMTLIVGENNVGKSFLLMESTVQASMNQKLNSILFTIEMNKMKQQNRIYSRITGIPYHKFRTAELTKKEMKIWKEKLEWWKEEKCGILHVVSFDKGATVVDIENKLKDAENKYGESFSLVSIDYLNDMKPLGKFQNSKGWDAMGEISWDLANLSKRWNNRKGIPIITANQKKTGKAGSGATSWDDAAFSPLPVQHASIGLGIGQDATDKEIGRIQWTLFKNRDGEKNITFYTFPDFQVSKIASRKKMMEYYEAKE